MGSDRRYPEEAPAHRVTVDGFWIDRHTVTNAEFARFVRKTGYLTVAERAPDPADRLPRRQARATGAASTVFVAPPHRVGLGNHYNWWTYVPGPTGATRGGRAARSRNGPTSPPNGYGLLDMIAVASRRVLAARHR
jgi:formylglycine-generating enzyme required for sulfatase activity